MKNVTNSGVNGESPTNKTVMFVWTAELGWCFVFYVLQMAALKIHM